MVRLLLLLLLLLVVVLMLVVVLPLLRTCCAVAAAAPMACGRAAGGARHARLQWRHGRGDAAVLGSAQAHARH